jgi:hypothetical protein
MGQGTNTSWKRSAKAENEFCYATQLNSTNIYYPINRKLKQLVSHNKNLAEKQSMT